MALTIKEYVGYDINKEVKSMAKCGGGKKKTTKTGKGGK